MFSPRLHLFLYVILCVLKLQSCLTEPILPPMLVLSSPGDPEYTDVLVKRVHDDLTLVCELRGDLSPRSYVWNYVPDNGTVGGERPFTSEPVLGGNKLVKRDMQVSDSGQYMCSAPPFSVTKYILVQTKGVMSCARGAFVCGARCVLVAYVCDGRRDCLRGEDEAPRMCGTQLCTRPDKLNCSSGRCISGSACCRGRTPLCQQPACCDEFTNTRDIEGYVDLEYPPLFEDRHAPDDYGFIQSTIYTVTACALIFMIAVVLLVSAICKMQMKRAALRGYTHADRATREHYSVQYHQAHRFPPCYEASRLLEQEGPRSPLSPSHSPLHLPLHQAEQSGAESPPAAEPPRGLARLSAIFSSRYRQVPTQPMEVEMRSLPPSPLPPGGAPRGAVPYRSPTYCELNTELILSATEGGEGGGGGGGRELNYMATPVDLFRRRTLRRNTLERVMDQLDRQRLTLQLGRFQVSIPRFGRSEPRPDTPNVAEINIDDLDFVRLNSNDTYTLNGRTIRLLGANFENYPVLPDGTVRPPSYTEAVRNKLYGPPPEYLSRERLNRTSADTVDEEATANIEMPPCYDDLNGNGILVQNNVTDNVADNDAANGNVSNESHLSDTASAVASDNVNGNVTEIMPLHNALRNTNSNVETLSSIIDNLPAIDSDLNANESETGVINDHVIRDNVINNGNANNVVVDNV